MSQAAYSDLKTAWHLDRIASLRRGEQVVPSQVHFIISDLCNHDCHFCAYRMSGGFSTEQFADAEGNKNPTRMIPKAKCLEILEDLQSLGVRAVQFTGGGEPTVHPDHLEIFQKALDLGLDCALVTNGFLLRDGWADVLPRFKWIRVSVDAGSAAVYSAVRKLTERAYARTLANVAKLASATSASGCLLGVGYVVTQENWRDLVPACKTFRELGVPYVRLAAMFSAEGSEYYKGIHGGVREAVFEAKALETESFSVVDLFGDRISDLNLGSPDYEFCGYQQFCTYIGGDQKVYRCCTTAYTKHGEIGDLTGQRYRDWFASEQKKQAIGSFDARSCRVCQFNGKNKTINYMVSQEPMHVNFV